MNSQEKGCRAELGVFCSHPNLPRLHVCGHDSRHGPGLGDMFFIILRFLHLGRGWDFSRRQGVTSARASAVAEFKFEVVGVGFEVSIPSFDVRG